MVRRTGDLACGQRIAARFFSQIDIPLIERRCYPAERISRGDDYEYRSAEGWSFTCPKHYICDIYYPARFSRELLAHSVL